MPSKDKNLERNKPAITSKPETATIANARLSRGDSNLLLIYLDDRTRAFVPAAQVMIEEFIEIHLRPENARFWDCSLAGRKPINLASKTVPKLIPKSRFQNLTSFWLLGHNLSSF